MKGRRGIRNKQLLDENKETIGYWQNESGSTSSQSVGKYLEWTRILQVIFYSIGCVETDVVNVTICSRFRSNKRYPVSFSMVRYNDVTALDDAFLLVPNLIQIVYPKDNL